MNKKVRLGFVGVGSMGQAAHLRNYVNLSDVEVVAIADIRPQLARKVADRFGIKRVYGSADELCGSEDLDAIVAIQNFRHHGSILPALYNLDVPILTEKPLAGTIDVAQRLLTQLADSASWHMVAYHKRSDPATIYAKKEIDRLKETGELGQLRYVRILMPAGDWIASGFSDLIHSGEPIPAIRPDPLAADLSPRQNEEYIEFVNYYIHQVNLMRHLLGEPYDVTYADPSGVLLTVQSKSGVAGAIEMSPYSTSIDWQETALVAFEHGYVKLSLPAPLALHRPGSVEIFRDGGAGVTPTIMTPQLPWTHAMAQQAVNFIAAVRGETKPPCEAAEALEDLVVARQYLLARGKNNAT